MGTIQKSVLPWMTLGALGASFFLAPEALPSRMGCWMKTFLGIPCPACGMTHAFCAIGHGRFAEAWALNPFSYLCFALGLTLALDGILGGHLYRRLSETLPLGRWSVALLASMFLGWILKFV